MGSCYSNLPDGWYEIDDGALRPAGPSASEGYEAVVRRPGDGEDVEGRVLECPHAASSPGCASRAAFAVHELPRDRPVGDYARGSVQFLCRHESDHVPADFASTSAYIYTFRLGEVGEVCVNGHPLSSEVSLMNDGRGCQTKRSRANNVTLVPALRVLGESRSLHVFVVPLRDIDAGEELLFGYGREYWVEHDRPASIAARARAMGVVKRRCKRFHRSI
jgi:hypothetical protein